VLRTGYETGNSRAGKTGITIKLPITKSVTKHTIGGYLIFFQKYNLFFSEISRELIKENNAPQVKWLGV